MKRRDMSRTMGEIFWMYLYPLEKERATGRILSALLCIPNGIEWGQRFMYNGISHLYRLFSIGD